MAGNIVAIVGRPNVGKSTLFNRLTQTRRAIVADVSGTTRDRQYGKSFWNGHEFSIIDTGGWVEGSEDIFENEIRRQVTIAVEEADVILYIVDVTVGINEYDTEIANMLRRVKSLFYWCPIRQTRLTCNIRRRSFIVWDLVSRIYCRR